MADRLHQVGLAEAGAAVNEERIVSDAGFSGHRFAGRVRKLAVGADHEALECVGGIQS